MVIYANHLIRSSYPAIEATDGQSVIEFESIYTARQDTVLDVIPTGGDAESPYWTKPYILWKAPGFQQHTRESQSRRQP